MKGLLSGIGFLLALAIVAPTATSPGFPQEPPKAEDSQEPPKGDEKDKPPKGGETQEPPKGKQEPPKADEGDRPPKPGETQEPPKEGAKEAPPPEGPPAKEKTPPAEVPPGEAKPPQEPPPPEGAPPVEGEEPAPEEPQEEPFDFDTDKVMFVIKKGESPRVEDILKAIRAFTGIPVIPSEKLDLAKEIKIIGPDEFTYPLLRKVLEMNSVELVHEKDENGDEIIKAMGAGRTGEFVQHITGRPTPVREVAAEQPEPPGMVTRIFRMKYADETMGQSLNNTLRQIKRQTPTDPGVFQFDQGSNAFIIRDLEENVEYLVRILEALDLPRPDMIFRVVTLEQASADAIAQIVESMFQGGRGAVRTPRRQPGQAVPTRLGGGVGEDVQVVADARTNKIIIRAMPDEMERIEDLIRELDVRVPFRQGKIHHYPLQDTKAEEIAEVLNAVISGSPLEQPGTGTQQPGVRTPQVQRPRVPGQLQSPGAGVGEVTTRIVPDAQTNSLIIQAEPDVKEDLWSLIEKLDRKKNQIFIEAQIWEVGIDDTLDLGVELTTLDRPIPGATRGGAITNFGLTTLEVDDPTNPTTFVRAPVITEGLTSFILQGAFDRVPFVINALARDSDAKILSTPFAITNDNSIAKFTISDRVPFQTSTLAGTGVSQGGFQFADATTLLEIEPTISAGNRLQLRLVVDIQTFTGTALGGAPPPSNSRRYEGIVTVPDRKYIVIGGLEQEQILQDVSKVPILGDIPLIGLLFQSRQTIKRRSRIFFFIKPTIFTDPEFARLKIASARLQGGLMKHNPFDYGGTVLKGDNLSTREVLGRLTSRDFEMGGR